jgi:uncharacterized protein (TIGR00290 family)
MPQRVISCWSGGKDSTLALYEIRENLRYELMALLATVTADFDRLSLHGVRRVLLERQAEALGHPLHTVFVSKDGSNEEYEERMRAALAGYVEAGVTAAVFGDLFLEDVRKYREEKLLTVGLQGIFPLWGRDTAQLAQSFIRLGFKAVITCVDTQVLDKDFAGREFDEKFLADLPPGVDPCGENGEFHSFVYEGPMFRHPLRFTRGEAVLRNDRFYFRDLLPE